MKKEKEEVKHLDVLMWVDDEPKVEEKMVYYVKRDKKIEKYLVETNKEKLEKLLKKVTVDTEDPSYLEYIVIRLLNNNVDVIDEIYAYTNNIEILDKKIKKRILV